MLIESVQNKIIKEVNSLKMKKERDAKGLFVLEGERLINAVPKDYNIKYIIRSLDYKGESPEATSYYVSKELFAKIADTVNPQGILAVCYIKNEDINTVSYDNNNTFLVLENVMDPGNMGTLIRTADAAGIAGVFISKGSVDIYNPKVIRSTMGSIFNLPIYRNVDMESLFNEFLVNNVCTVAGHLMGNLTPYEVEMAGNCAILIGNEASGISDKLSNKANYLVKIPMRGKAESMNASIAGAILIYEALRQKEYR